MDTTCSHARNAMVEGEVTPEIGAHLATCSDCRSARQVAALFRAATTAPAAGALDDAFEPGQALLHYTLLERIGRGGQGVVYKATERDLPGSVVALKIVRSDPSSLKEARAKPITHPNVIRINHTTVHGSYRLIEMEYIAGGTLDDRLATTASGAALSLSREERLAIFRGVLEGVRAVHESGLLHLDLKPLNILLRRGFEPVVTDFGMSARPGSQVLGGTRGWTAPEVDRGEVPDVRADVYSLGAILEALMPDPAPALADVIACAEASRREERYPDVPALRAAFEEALLRDAAPAPAPPPAPAPAPALPPPPRPEPRARRFFPLAVAALLAVAGAAFLVDRWLSPHDDVSPPQEPSAAPPEASAPATSPLPTLAPSAVIVPAPRKPPHPKPLSSPAPSAPDPPKLKHPGVL